MRSKPTRSVPALLFNALLFLAACGPDPDTDECVTNNGGCDPLTACTNTVGSRTCGPCPGGYTGDGYSGCTDIDECVTNNGGCDPNATCTNTVGSRTCSCKTGYTGDGITCTSCQTAVCGKSCKALLAAGITADGVYAIDADGAGPLSAVQVQCDMTRDGGGWTFGLKAWYQAGVAGQAGAVGTVADALTLKGNGYKLADEVIRVVIGPLENFDLMADQAGYNSAYSTGNYEYVLLRNYTGQWRYDTRVPASTTPTTMESNRLVDGALAWSGELACGTGGFGINCYTVLSGANPAGGAGCSINMGSATNLGWHHFYTGETNSDTYLYICNGAQHSSSYPMNHRFWFRER